MQTEINSPKGEIVLPMPDGKAGVAFSLKEQTNTGVVFENLDHAFPRTITYRLENRDTIVT